MKKVRHHLNHQQNLIPNKSWQDIAAFYEYLGNPEMLNLVRHISENYSYGIFAVTSMHTLCLAQTESFSLTQNVIKVDYYGGKIKFNYIDPKKSESTGWIKICQAKDAVNTFEHVINCLKWIIR